jgi:phenylpyruvate tautomerase PptA (4-oxalocrotonate tautomerase family)
MPHLLVRGIKAEEMAKISEPLAEELAAICECGTDNFTIECLHTTGVFGGKVVDSFPFIEVAWFERGQQTRDRFAQAVTRHVLSLDIPEVEVAFKAYEKKGYYANGEHF